MKFSKVSVAGLAIFSIAIGVVAPVQASETKVDVLDALQSVQNIQAKPAEMRVLDNVAAVDTSFGSADPVSTKLGDVDVTVPATTAEPLELASIDGKRMSVSLPFGSGAVKAEEIARGIIEYDNGNGSSTVPILKEDGSVQVTTVIDGPSSPTSYAYEFDLAPGDRLEMQENGSIAIFSEAGKFEGGIAAAWATDAVGSPVPTAYRIDGNTVTQVIQHGSNFTYPVVADPWLGVDLINYFVWKTSNTISVHVTPWMGTVSTGVAGSSGWDELKSKVRASSNGRFNELLKSTYYQQWYCHSLGKVAIFLGQVTGMDKNSSWDLEGYRSTNSNFATWVYKRCNW